MFKRVRSSAGSNVFKGQKLHTGKLYFYSVANYSGWLVVAPRLYFIERKPKVPCITSGMCCSSFSVRQNISCQMHEVAAG